MVADCYLQLGHLPAGRVFAPQVLPPFRHFGTSRHLNRAEPVVRLTGQTKATSSPYRPGSTPLTWPRDGRNASAGGCEWCSSFGRAQHRAAAGWLAFAPEDAIDSNNSSEKSFGGIRLFASRFLFHAGCQFFESFSKCVAGSAQQRLDRLGAFVPSGGDIGHRKSIEVFRSQYAFLAF